MTSSQHCGDLHRVFPQEIRNHIYEYVLLGQAFIVAGEHLGNGFEDDDYETPKTKFADMAVLRSSRIIYQEAKRVLYTKGLFRIYLNFSHWDSEPLKLPTQERADLIANLEIVIDLESWDFHIGSWEELDLDEVKVSDKLETAVQMFSTLRVLRNTCYVRFALFSGDFAHEVLDTNVVEMVFSRLVGFENLIFQVEVPSPSQRTFMKGFKCDEEEAWELSHNESSCKICAQGKVASPDGEEWLIDYKGETAAEVIDQAREFYSWMRERYDGHLGAPGETDIQLHARNWLFLARVKYHPLQSLIKKMRRDAELLLGEANALESGNALVRTTSRSRARYAACQELPVPTPWED